MFVCSFGLLNDSSGGNSERKAFHRELPHPLGPREVLQLLRAEIDAQEIRRQPVDHERVRCVGHHHLAAVGDALQPCAPVHHLTEVVVVAEFAHAGVQCAAHAQIGIHRPAFLGDAPLHECGRDHCVGRVAEHGVERVAHGLEHGAAAAFDHAAQHVVMVGDDERHRVLVEFPLPRRALDVGEQERHRAAREERDVVAPRGNSRGADALDRLGEFPLARRAPVQSVTSGPCNLTGDTLARCPAMRC